MSFRQTSRGIRLVRGLLSLFAALFLLSPLSAAIRHAVALQPDYALALAAVDHFLQAWQSNDAENGMALLTSHAKKIATSAGVEKFFSNPNASAYEIGRGKALKRGRYEFPVVLVQSSKNSGVRRQASTLLVLNTGGNDWAIDKLP